MKRNEIVLFLCTGNYYRSRLAEHYFNALAINRGSTWRAESRGLRLSIGNPGPISRQTIRWLEAKGIVVPEPIREPQAVTETDLQRAGLVVAVKEAEHRPLLEANFPARIDHVEFWHIHDLDVATSEEALPVLAAHVEALLLRLSSSNSQTG